MNTLKHLECSFRAYGQYGKQPYYFILCGADYIQNPIAENKQEVTCSNCLELSQHINEIQKHILHKPALQAGYTNFPAIFKLKGFSSMIEAINAGYSFVHNGKPNPIINIIKNPDQHTSMDLTEVPFSREYYGGRDGKAINQHSQREYSIAGSDKILVVDRNNSISPPTFDIWFKPDKNYRGIIKYHAPEIAAKGQGISWAKFIKLLEEELMPAS